MSKKIRKDLTTVAREINQNRREANEADAIRFEITCTTVNLNEFRRRGDEFGINLCEKKLAKLHAKLSEM